MMKLEIDSTGCIQQAIDVDEPEREGCTYIEYEGLITWSAPTASSRLRLVAGVATWVEEATIAQQRAAKIVEINAAHELANRTSFTFNGKQIQANEHSMNQIQTTNGGVLLRGGMHPQWQGAWKAMDNTYVAIPDVATWKLFYDAIETTGQANFAKAQALKVKLAAATSAEEIASINWEST